MIKDHDWVDLLLGEAHAGVLRREGMSEADVQTSMDLFWFDPVVSQEDVAESFDAVIKADANTKIRLISGAFGQQHWFTDEEGRYGLRCTGPECFICKLLRQREDQ